MIENLRNLIGAAELETARHKATMETITGQLPEATRLAMDEAGIKRANVLAKITGLSNAAISYFLAGKQIPAISTIKMIAENIATYGESRNEDQQ